jgi:hypothetical protein
MIVPKKSLQPTCDTDLSLVQSDFCLYNVKIRNGSSLCRHLERLVIFTSSALESFKEPIYQVRIFRLLKTNKFKLTIQRMSQGDPGVSRALR